MKQILSFFMSALCILQIYTVGIQSCFAQTDITVQSGITFSDEHFQASCYGEFEKSADTNLSGELNSWAVRLQPFDLFSIAGGTLVYGGIWSRFNNPSPLSINALKQPYTLSTRLITSLPNKETKTAQPSLSVSLNFPFLKINTFIAGFKENQLSSGIGLTLPFSLKSHSKLLPAGLRGTWNLAWKVSFIEQKENDSWFIPQPHFVSEYYHSFIQELALKTKHHTLLFTMGLSQSPYGKPSGFTRTEYSLKLPVFLLNGQFFLSDIDYLSQNGSFERDTVRIAINPQLRFNFLGTAIRSIRLGIMAETTYQHTTDIISKSDWYTSFKFETDIQIVMFTLGAGASISDLVVAKGQDSTFPLLQKDSLLTIQSKVVFRPWYANSFSRTWTINCDYEQYIKKPDSSPSFNVKGSFSGSFRIAKVHRFGINATTELHFKVPKKMTLNTITCSLKATTDLYINLFSQTQRLQLTAQTELDIKEGKLDGITAEFSVVLRL